MAEHEVAREWGQEFVRVLEQIGKPSITPHEEEVREALQSDSIRIFDEMPNIPKEWAGVILNKVVRVLEKASVSPSFKQHLAEMVVEQLSFGPMRMLGSTPILDQSGIDPASDRWDIFESYEKGKEVEKAAIKTNIPFRRLLSNKGELEAHHQKMDFWTADYTRTYGESPLD